jgi:hypothetical protein
MSQEIVHYFAKLAESAIERCHKRAADRKFFENVRERLDNGDHLSDQLPELKQVSAKTAATVVDNLIRRCDTDMLSYWESVKSNAIQCRVEMQRLVGELIPRFNVEYAIATELGTVVIRAISQGNHTDINIDSSSIHSTHQDAALKEAKQQLVFAVLDS